MAVGSVPDVSELGIMMSKFSRILITGAASGIGQKLVESYIRRGVTVVAVDKAPCSHHMSANGLVVAKTVDISDGDAIAGLVNDLVADDMVPDAYIFCAAIHKMDNEKFVEYDVFKEVIDVNMMSVVKFMSCILPIQSKRTTFAFCSSGVITFPNPSYLGYFISKSAISRMFDVFSDRYVAFGFEFKQIILGPVETPMLSESKKPGGFVGLLRRITTGTPEIAAEKIICFMERRGRRMCYRLSSMLILQGARIVQTLLPASLTFYRVKPVAK